MEVANSMDTNSQEENAVPEQGAELIQKLVTLTGMPEELMHEELGGILQQAGEDASTVTLEQLRSAMILYLEQLERESLAAEAADNSTQQ
jgi:hypothetical protein